MLRGTPINVGNPCNKFTIHIPSGPTEVSGIAKALLIKYFTFLEKAFPKALHKFN